MAARRGREAEVAVVRPAQPRTTPQAVSGATEHRLPGALEVPIEQVVADLGQPRRDWQHGDGAARLEELAASIAEFGILQPLLVREEGTLTNGRQRYVIIAGARRRAAAERVGLALLPVVVRDDESGYIRVLQLIENLQRQNLSALDEARAYQELIDMQGLTPQALAAQLHVSGQQVRDRLRLLADQVLADAVERRQISATAAREMMKLPDEEVIAFKERVQHGERLQTNDVAVARARLEAAGIINPRRKVVRAPRQSEPPTAPERAPDHIVLSPTSEELPAADKTSFDQQPHDRPSPPPNSNTPRTVADGGTIESEQRRYHFEVETALPSQPAGLTDDQQVAARAVAQALDAALRGTRRTQVRAALDAAAGSTDLAAWWLLVYRELQERLTQVAES